MQPSCSSVQARAPAFTSRRLKQHPAANDKCPALLDNALRV
ncbi:hypothetical protein ACFOLD_08825 [Kocuria carniphila]